MCRDKSKWKVAAVQTVWNQQTGFLEQLYWAVIPFDQGRGGSFAGTRLIQSKPLKYNPCTTSQGKRIRPSIIIPNKISHTRSAVNDWKPHRHLSDIWNYPIYHIQRNNGKVTPSLPLEAGAFLHPILTEPANFSESCKLHLPGNQQPCRNTSWHLPEFPKGAAEAGQQAAWCSC